VKFGGCHPSSGEVLYIYIWINLLILVVNRLILAAEDSIMTTTQDMRSPVAMKVDDFRRLIGGISRSHFYQLVARRKIRVVKLGNRTVVPISEAKRLLGEI
jgi:hypothetical protein